MTFKSKDELFALTRSAAYQDFLFQRESSSGHFMRELEELSNRAMDAAMLEIFHGMIYLFQAYPNLHSVRPRWEPYMEIADKEFHVRTKIEVEMKDGKGVVGVVQIHGYDSFPLEIGDNQEPFALLVELAETIYPDLWSSFKYSELASTKERFTSIDQVSQVMQSDLSRFTSEFEQWALMQTTPQAPSTTRRPSL